MSEQAYPDTFQAALTSFEATTADSEAYPIPKAGLLDQLVEVQETGTAGVNETQLSVAALAQEVAKSNQTVLDLDRAKQIKPPLTQNQRRTIASTISSMNLLVKASGETGQTAEKTDLAKVPTADAKSSKGSKESPKPTE